MNRLARVSAAALLVTAAAGCNAKETAGVHEPFFPSIAAEQTVTASALRDRVEILVDDQGVPHIYATHEHDAAFVQGYVSARDRFFQMDLLRRVSTGRVSELFGRLDAESTLEADLEMRRIMMTGRGTMIFDEQLAALEPDEQALILRYTDGINTWLADAKAGRNGVKPPAEYDGNPFLKSQQVFFADVPEWTAGDTFAIGRFQQWNLAGTLGDELKGARLRDELDPELFEKTWLFEPADPTLSVDDFFTTEAPFKGLTDLLRFDEPTPAELRQFRTHLRGQIKEWRYGGREYLKGDIPGSNNWVVGPSLTGGNAMLANDPHLTLLNPPLFYHTHVNTTRFGGGNWNTIGVTFPGIPGLLAGHNENVAWGVTTLGYDVTDLYREELSGTDAVKFNGSTVPVAWSEQTFVFGTGENAREEVVRMPYVPHHGPVVSGEEALSGKDADLITMRWTGAEQTTDFRAFFGLLSAASMDDFFRAVAWFDVGAQSFVGADVDGNIGYFGHALVPVRPWLQKEQKAGGVVHFPDAPLPGAGGFEWDGWLEDEDLVQAKNPAKGYIVTANNDIVGTTLDNDPFNDPQYYWYWQDLGFRVARISRLIEEFSADHPLTLEDMIRIQDDTFSMEAERAVPRILAALEAVTASTLAGRRQEAIDYLKIYKFGSPTGVKSEFRTDEPTAEEKTEAIGTSIYFTLQRILAPKILEDEYEAADASHLRPGSQTILKFMLKALENPDYAVWFDDVRTVPVETAADIILLALDETLARLDDVFDTTDMSQWQWGKIHVAQSADLVGMVTGQSMEPLGPVANDGTQHTVDVANFNGDYVQGAGSQIRMVVEMKKGAVESWSQIPGGQVADRNSPHYDDQYGGWITNQRVPYRFYDKDVEANAKSRWVFVPR